MWLCFSPNHHHFILNFVFIAPIFNDNLKFEEISGHERIEGIALVFSLASANSLPMVLRWWEALFTSFLFKNIIIYLYLFVLYPLLFESKLLLKFFLRAHRISLLPFPSLFAPLLIFFSYLSHISSSLSSNYK